MSFQESAAGWKAKAHISEVKTPVLVGICALALAAVFLVVQSLGSVALGSGFEIPAGEHASQGAEAEGTSGEEGLQPAPTKEVTVHVGGMVVAPGVYELAEGSRVQAAIEAAGGFSEEAARDSLNLARVLLDGEQILVPSVNAVETAPEAAGSGGAVVGGKVNINTAGVSDLDSLPGIGEATAQKIIADRETNGPFSSIEDLKRVSGIGEKKYAQLADLICI